MTKVYVLYDLDGTIYDSLSVILDTTNEMLDSLLLKQVSRKHLRKVYQTFDCDKMYRDLGVPEGEIASAQNCFREIFAKKDTAELIPGSIEAIKGSREVTAGTGILTHATEDRTLKQLRGDNAEYLFDPIISLQHKGEFICKGQALAEHGERHPDHLTLYVGDSVSDGIATLVAREAGARVQFVGMTHEYSFNTDVDMIRFACKYPSAASTCDSLESLMYRLRAFEPHVD